MEKNNDSIEPEIIYVDEAYEEKRSFGGRQEQRYWSTIEGLGQADFPIGLRIIALIVAGFMGFLAAFMCGITIVWFVASLLAMRQSPRFNELAKNSWATTRKFFLIAFGSLVAVFSPALGIGMILLYFMIIGEKMNEAMFTRFSSYSRR